MTIFLKNATTASSPAIGDVAKIEGNAKLAHFLRSIKIDRVYLLDGVLTKSELEKILHDHYIDTGKITIKGGPLKLYKKASRITKSELEKAVREYVQGRYKDFVIESVSIPVKSMEVPADLYRFNIKERSKTFRHLYLDIEITSPQGYYKKLPATVKVIQYIPAAFAKRDIPKGKVITPEDVEIRKIKRYNSMQKGVEPKLLYGSVAKRTIRQGQQIRSSAYEPDYLVKKRSSVKILYDRGGIRIELMGLALENGQKGDIIKVKNLSSNKVLRCKVLSSGSVQFVQ